MNQKKKFIITEDYITTNSKENINSKISYIPRNVNYKLAKRKYKIIYNHDLLINLLKKQKFKKSRGESQPKSKLNISSFNNIKVLNTDFSVSYNLNKRFHNLPGLTKFHNLTQEKINNLIQSDENGNKSNKIYDITKSKIIFNRNISMPKKKEIIYNRDKDDKNNNFIIYKNKKDFHKNSIASRKKLLNVRNSTNNLSFLKNNNQILNIYDSFNNFKNKKDIIKKLSASVINMKKTKKNRIKKYNTQIWLSSIRDSIKKYEILRRDSKVDRLAFYIEKPEECFEENLFENKPGDQYQLFKNQIAKHKQKLENIIKEIKLNQIKSEYLMKKYIFDLLSRKKKIY